ncbi:VOC family protein [Gracilimonas sp.]|uniref:VOC family protein n=1 Tax=Gracilimonas sp. TaxID=1974203 RepID=UPI0032EC554B
MNSLGVYAIVFYVNDINATLKHYEKIGFNVEVIKEGHLKIALSNFEFEFHDKKLETIEELKAEANKDPKGNGAFIYVKSNDIYTDYESIKESGAIVSNISKRPWGTIEFSITDPDGYKLMIYQLSNE